MAPRVGDETIRNFPGAPSGDPLVGSVVDSYRVESVVGSGAMGIVYRATHMVIGKPVAIKVLKADFADDPDMVQRLVREARTVNAIRHPAIVDAFGFGTLPRTGQPYIVMDLLLGEPLDAFVQREAPMSLKAAGRILEELLSGLWAAHQAGVIHRDLKPGNCFLESQADGGTRLKLLDFGLARQADRAGGSVRPTNPGTLIGTPAFMAPEQVMGQKTGPATDLYAVGGIAYQMLTGHLPHEAPSAIEVLTQKMQFDPVRPRQWNAFVSEELDAWVMSLLHRDPDQRPKDAETARRALRRLIEARTISESPAYTGSSPSSLRSRHTPAPLRDWGESRTVLVENAPAAETRTLAMPAVDVASEPTAREAPSPLISSPLASRRGVVEDLGDEATLLRPIPSSGSLPPTPVPSSASRPPVPVASSGSRPPTPVASSGSRPPAAPPASTRTPLPQPRLAVSPPQPLAVTAPDPSPPSAPTARLAGVPPTRPPPGAASPRDELQASAAPPRLEARPPPRPPPGVPRGLVIALVFVTGVLLIFLVMVALKLNAGG